MNEIPIYEMILDKIYILSNGCQVAIVATLKPKFDT